MQVSNILNYIDSGHFALPEFQRGYVWNREQVRGLFSSLYRRHPIGGLLVWATDSDTATRRGDGPVASGVVKLLLDGQQRMTTLYGVARGQPPKFFDGNPNVFTKLMFNLSTETFEFFQPVKMRDDPLWIDVTNLMKNGQEGFTNVLAELNKNDLSADQVTDFTVRLSNLLHIFETDLHIQEVTGPDKTLDIVVDIFNRVNSGGTKLSKGDLAIAKICADWPDARDSMKSKVAKWSDAGYSFSLDWLLRSVNTILTGEAKFVYLHDKSGSEVEAALDRAEKYIDLSLEMISGRLGLDHDRVLFGRNGIPVMVRFLDDRQGELSAEEWDKLLFWYAQAGMWGRFSGSTESFIDQDLAVLEPPQAGADQLIEQLRLWHGGFGVEAEHFGGATVGARFYPALYMLTRTGKARDWGNGMELKANLLGKMNKLELHHIFPKSQLNKLGLDKKLVNALANFCFLTKNSNLKIANRLPKDYFPEIEERHPGALESQWIPTDPDLWSVDRYRDFLEERRKLLANATNDLLRSLLPSDSNLIELNEQSSAVASPSPAGGISTEEEEAQLEKLNEWVACQGFSRGTLAFDFADPESGAQNAVFDLVWPNGIQPGLTEPAAVLLDEGADVLGLATSAGFRCFTEIQKFKEYVETEILSGSNVD